MEEMKYLALCLAFFVKEIATKNVLMLIADDAGFETSIYNNSVCKTPNLNRLGERSVIFKNAFTSVSSCSPSSFNQQKFRLIKLKGFAYGSNNIASKMRSVILSGLPQHQNGMYGLHQGYHHFMSFDQVRSLPYLLHKHNIRTGIVGKKHVGPEAVYPFDYAETEENNSILQVGRNITHMKHLVREFFTQNDTRPFFLYVGFHDPHRCEHTHPQFGAFCEKFGNGEPGMGNIPDWKPVTYDPVDVLVPYFVQDTLATRQEIAKQYTTISRLDQGIGLILEELKKAGHDEDTLILYTSDNGIPFINGRTNLYDSGMGEPFLLYSPKNAKKNGQISDAMVSHVDIVPTVLDWFDIKYPRYKLNGRLVQMTGKSLLSIMDTESHSDMDTVYASHNLHEVTMYYPMRVIRNKQYKLIHNINYRMPFSIDQDFFISNSFQDLLNRTRSGAPTHWFKTLKEYYYREEWELYDIQNDPKELKNLVNHSNGKYKTVFQTMKSQLLVWQNMTRDPWICAPGGVLEDTGAFKSEPQCFSMDNFLV